MVGGSKEFDGVFVLRARSSKHAQYPINEHEYVKKIKKNQKRANKNLSITILNDNLLKTVISCILLNLQNLEKS